MKPGDDHEAGQRPQPDRGEHALLEPVVELEDLVRQRGSLVRIRRPKLRIVSSPPASSRTTTDADREDDLDVARQAAPERHEAGREPEDDDREQVEDPLDEDRPEGPRQRDAAVDLEQVRPVDVAELGRHEAVHEPRQEDDLDAVADLEQEAGLPDEHRPAQAAEREPDVEDRRRPRAAAAGSRRGILSGSSSSLKPGRARTNRTSRTIGRISEMIVRGCRRRRGQRELVRADLVVGRRSGGGGPAGIARASCRSSSGRRAARTRPGPRTRCTSFAAGVSRRT